MLFLKRLDRCLANAERIAMILLLSGLIGVGLCQVILRNLLSSGLFWADELLRHMVLWLGFLGASLATYERSHLRIDILARVLPARCKPWIVLCTDSAAAVVCAVLTEAAWAFVHDEYAAGTILSFGIATWLAQSIIPLGFLIMTVRFVMGPLANLDEMRHGQKTL